MSLADAGLVLAALMALPVVLFEAAFVVHRLRAPAGGGGPGGLRRPG